VQKAPYGVMALTVAPWRLPTGGRRGTKDKDRSHNMCAPSVNIDIYLLDKEFS
jgi:hypothetical protein